MLFRSLLSSNNTSHKEYARFEMAAKGMEQYQQQTAEIDSLREQDADAWLQANYLYGSAGILVMEILKQHTTLLARIFMAHCWKN